MAINADQDPWVMEHRRLLAEDAGYREFSKAHDASVRRIVNRYHMGSSFKAIGLLVILGGLALGMAHLAYVHFTSGADVIAQILGRNGAGQQAAALLRVLAFSAVMPVMAAIGAFIVSSGVRNDRTVKLLDYSTRMVEGYRRGLDPAEMERPKRY